VPNPRPALGLQARSPVLAPSGPGPRLADAWQIPLARIDLNPYQARQHFDEAALDELTASVREHGVLEPILVRPVGDGERYEILAGERRYRAAQAAGLDAIPALVRHGLDDGQARVITALENLQREDLLPGDEARQYAGLITALDISRRELARRLGIDHNRIARLLTILDKGPGLFDAIDAGELSVNAALGQLDTGYYTGAKLSQIETVLQDGSSADPAAPPIALTSAAGTRLLAPEDFAAPEAEPRVHRHELLDPIRSQQLTVAFKPAARFAHYVSRLQPADVPAADRVPLAERLEAAAQEASLLARALRQAADEARI